MRFGRWLYAVLHRVYGLDNNMAGQLEATQAALAKEQARVDLLITKSLGVPQRPAHRFDGVEGTS